MTARLHGAEVRFDSEDECFHLTLPAGLSPIIGRHGRLRCRLDAVRRADLSVATTCADSFDAAFDAAGRLVLPRELANRRGVSIDSRVDVTLEARFRAAGWAFWRRAQAEPIYPNDDVTIDMADAVPADGAAPAGVTQPPPSHLDVLKQRVAADMAMIQAAIDAPAGDQDLRRMRMALARVTPDAPAANRADPARAQPSRSLQDFDSLYRAVRDSRPATDARQTPGRQAGRV